jgi:hypothetical protein
VDEAQPFPDGQEQRMMFQREKDRSPNHQKEGIREMSQVTLR